MNNEGLHISDKVIDILKEISRYAKYSSGIIATLSLGGIVYFLYYIFFVLKPVVYGGDSYIGHSSFTRDECDSAIVVFLIIMLFFLYLRNASKKVGSVVYSNDKEALEIGLKMLRNSMRIVGYVMISIVLIFIFLTAYLLAILDLP